MSSGTTTLLHDTFTDTNGTSLTSHTMDTGSGWTNFGTSTLDIQTNKAHGTAGNGQDMTYANAGQSNITISCDLTNTTSGLWPGLLGRCLTTDNSGSACVSPVQRLQCGPGECRGRRSTRRQKSPADRTGTYGVSSDPQEGITDGQRTK
jgi:hypothetical protein